MSGRAYISIVRWPSGFTPQHRLEALSDALGLDPYTAGLRAAADAPAVVGRVDESAAPHVIARLKTRKVLAFALTQTHIARLPQPKLIKRLTPALGAADPMYMVEFWKGDPAGLRSADIFLLVRATVDRSTVRTTITTGPSRTSGYGFGIGGMALSAAANAGGAMASRNTESKVSQILDIYLKDQTLLRINSDRVSFDVLGKDRAFTAAENTDKIALRLASEAPTALVDTGFPNFKPPPDLKIETTIASVSGSTALQRDEGSAFDFYSGWIYTINRGLSGG